MPATSTDGIAMEKLRRMFSLSATLQAESGGTAAAAEAHVHFGSVANLSDQSAYPRPLVLIGLDDRIDTMIAGGDQNFLRASGKFAVTMIRNDSGNVNTSDEYLAQLEWFSAVISEVAALANDDDIASLYTPNESHLSVTRIDLDAFGLVEESLGSQLMQFYGMETTVWWGDSVRERHS